MQAERMICIFVVDRFEGDFVSINTNNGVMVLSRHDIPEDAKEGDLLEFRVAETKSMRRTKSDNTDMIEQLFLFL
jgi:hypothetical protein